MRCDVGKVMTVCAALVLPALMLLAMPAQARDAGAPPQAEIPSMGDPCRLDIRPPGQTAWRGVYGRGYDPSAGEALEQTDLVVVHDGPSCRWFVSGERPAVGAVLTSPSGGTLAFDVMITPNGPSLLSDDPQGTPFSRIPGDFPAGMNSMPIPLFVSIRPGQIVRAGSYSGQTVIRLYRAGDGAPELVALAPLTVSAMVPPTLAVTSSDFAPGLTSGTVDLGRLEAGGRHNIRFDVTANTDVSVAFTSANGGYLKHEFSGSRIPYDFYLNGKTVSLIAPVRDRFASGPQAPLSLDLEIVVAPQASALAGAYHDDIIITFSAEN